MKNIETLLRLDEVGEMLTVSPRTIQGWVKERLMPHIKIGGAVRFRLSDIQRIQQEGLPRNKNRKQAS